LFFKMPVIIFFTFTHDTCWNHVNLKNKIKFASVFMLGNGLKVGSWFCTQWHPWSGGVPKVNIP
jgi:hypothetical protein